MIKRHLKALHDLSRANKALVKESKRCGCYGCSKMFQAGAVTKWIDKASSKRLMAQETALCPYCGLDTVLTDAAVKLSKDMLDEMNDYWFGTHMATPAETMKKTFETRTKALEKLTGEERDALGFGYDEWDEY